MTAVRPRLEEAETELERELLRTWAAEAPPAAAEARALALATQVGGASVVAAGGAIASAAARVAGTSTALGFGKWGAVVSMVAVSASAVLGVRALAPASAPQNGAAVAPGVRQPIVLEERGASSPRSVSEPSVAEPATTSNGAVERAVGGPAPAANPPATAHASLVHPKRSDATKPLGVVSRGGPVEAAPAAEAPHRVPLRLGEEVALLDRARASFASGDGAGALRDLDAYQARFPAGALSEEATVLSIRVLQVTGEAASARALGERFLETHGNSSHATRVRRLLGIAP